MQTEPVCQFVVLNPRGDDDNNKHVHVYRNRAFIPRKSDAGYELTPAPQSLAENADPICVQQ